MSEPVLARRASVKLLFDGTDITKDIQPYLLSLTYTDSEDGEADGLTLKLADREGLWLTSWLTEAVEAAADAKLKIDATIIRRAWAGTPGGKDWRLPCGRFELDSVEASGPPAVVSLKASSLPFTASISQTKKSKSWENCRLSAIAGEIARDGGLGLLYESAADPLYERREQSRVSDAAFLKRLCEDAGLSLKCAGGKLVVFDQSAYEKQPPAMSFRRGDRWYTKYKLKSGTAGVRYASCRVSCTDPATGQCIEGAAKSEDYNERAENNRRLEIKAQVRDAGEARALAEKKLRLHNKFAKTASFTLPGNPGLAAGMTVQLERWGGWSGKYLIACAEHTVNGGGYTTKVTLRRCLGG